MPKPKLNGIIFFLASTKHIDTSRFAIRAVGSLAHCEAGDVAGSALQITLAGNDVLDDRIHEGDVLCSHPAIQSLAETGNA